MDGSLYGRDADGDEAQETVYGKTRAEIRDKLAKALADRADGIVYDDENLTVGAYLDRWLSENRRRRRADAPSGSLPATSKPSSATGRVRPKNG